MLAKASSFSSLLNTANTTLLSCRSIFCCPALFSSFQVVLMVTKIGIRTGSYRPRTPPSVRSVPTRAHESIPSSVRLGPGRSTQGRADACSAVGASPCCACTAARHAYSRHRMLRVLAWQRMNLLCSSDFGNAMGLAKYTIDFSYRSRSDVMWLFLNAGRACSCLRRSVG